MIADSKSKNLQMLSERLKLEEAKYDALSLRLIKIDSKTKEWEEVSNLYNISATKIYRLGIQIEIVNRTGKMLGDSEEYAHTVIGNPYFDD